jgi:phosphoribosylglycinamide formyltransferase-1
MLNPERPIRLAVLCSHRAPGIEELLHNPARGVLYEIVCVITSEPSLAQRSAIEDAGVPVLNHPIRQYHDECGAALRDHEARRSYDAMTVHVFEQLHVDAALLLGYLYVLTDVVLAALPGRIFNIHDSDLSVTVVNGARKYVGLHSTRDAILAGEAETRSTLHLVTTQLDAGPIVTMSPSYQVAPFIHQAVKAGFYDIVKAYAYAHREWMMRDSWGGMAIFALERLARGTDLLQELSPDPAAWTPFQESSEVDEELDIEVPQP